MLVKQISIILENRLGQFADIAGLLGQNGINMKAFTVSENEDFGMVRMIVDKTELAKEVLLSASYAVSVNQVVAYHCPDEPGAMAHVMNALRAAEVFIEYMYAFGGTSEANLVIRCSTKDTARCEEIISKLPQGFA